MICLSCVMRVPPAPAATDAAQINLACASWAWWAASFTCRHPTTKTQPAGLLANEALVRTASVAHARDGGQNLIGPSKAPTWRHRTQELLRRGGWMAPNSSFTRRATSATRRIRGNLRIWARTRAGRRGVGHPSFPAGIIITRSHPEQSIPTGTIRRRRAWRSSVPSRGDPNFHPEQLSADVVPWQATRFLWNRSSWSIKPTTTCPNFMTLDVDATSLLGLSYGEMAADSRSITRARALASRAATAIIEYFKSSTKKIRPRSRLRGADGDRFSWGRLKGTTAVKRLSSGPSRNSSRRAYKLLPTLYQLDNAG